MHCITADSLNKRFLSALYVLQHSLNKRVLSAVQGFFLQCAKNHAKIMLVIHRCQNHAKVMLVEIHLVPLQLAL
jgi:hypothetical protein